MLDRKRIIFLTNLPAPYRFPIFDKMTEFVDLKVFFILGERNWRNWPAPTNRVWQHEFLDLFSIRIKEYEFVPQFKAAKKVLKCADLVIVGSWEIPIYMRTIYLAKKSGVPIVQIYESIEKSQRFRSGFIARVRSSLIKKATFVVTFGAESTKAVQDMGVPHSSILELFNPVDVSWFHNYSIKNRVPDSDGHKYLYVGQLIERKNLFNLIDAFNHVHSENDTLMIVGEGHLKSTLEEYVKTKTLHGKVIFVGPKNQLDLAAIYSKSNTLVLASENEVWGLVVNEALACGMHVVVSKNSGVSAFVDGMPGVFLSATDSQSIAKSMTESKSQWEGFVESPPIMGFTPELFAELLMAHIEAYGFK